MGSLQAQISLTDQDWRSASTTQGSAHLGQEMPTSDGKKFRYGKNGTGSGTALVAGQLQQGAVVTANHVNRTGVTAAAGVQTVTFAVGATLVSANQYAQGYLVVNAGTGAGQILEIAGNTAAGSSGSPTVNLQDAIITATLVSDSKFSLHPNLYSACIQSSSTLAAGVAGVAMTALADASYGWFQTGGPCSVLSDAGAAAVGAPVTYSDDTPGAVGPYETDAVGPTIGYTMILGVSAEYRPVFLVIN